MLNFRIEKKLIRKNNLAIVGLDEVGRGPIAGPLAVGAVFLDLDFHLSLGGGECWWKLVNDSKKLAPKIRAQLANKIEKSFPTQVGMVSAKYIDSYGLTKAIEKATQKAIKKFKSLKPLFLVDGKNRFFKSKRLRQIAIKSGDAKIFSVACASIIAKVKRDNYMKTIHNKWPKYRFDLNKGYGTRHHFHTLNQFGPCRLHRVSFAPLRKKGS